MVNVLLTDPGHDFPTQMLSHWITSAADYMQTLGNIRVVHLQGNDVTHANFHSTVVSHNPRLLLLNGHGSETTMYGHSDLPILDSNDIAEGQFDDRIIHALACKVGAVLGHDLIANGVSTFIGYKEDFQVVHTSGDLNDAVAALYLDPAFSVPRSLAEGKSTQDAFIGAQKMYAENLKEALRLNAGIGILAPLYSNMQHHVLLGSTTAMAV